MVYYVDSYESIMQLPMINQTMIPTFTIVTPQILIHVSMEDSNSTSVRTYLIHINMFFVFVCFFMTCLQAYKRTIIATTKAQSLPLS